MELTQKEIQRLGQKVVDFITYHLSSLDDSIILPANLVPARLREILDEPLPREPQGIDAAFDDFLDKVVANSVRVGHPRFLAWMRTSPLAAAIYAQALAAAINQSVSVWEGGPSATEVELRVIEWLKEITGYAPEAGGLLTSGGSMANFTGLQAARSAADPDVRFSGLTGKPPFTIYVTSETHYSICKAAEMMGIGWRYVRQIAMDSNLCMEPVDLRRQIQSDLAAGLRPMAVVGTLGSTSTGACDDLAAIGKVCQEMGIWLHVDGAYGGCVNLLPEKRHLADGLAQADSFVIDPHKTLMMPFEVGCILVKNPTYLYKAFAAQTDYLPNSTFEDPDAPFNFRDYGPQLSRGFRALKIYLALKVHGVNALVTEITRQFALAEKFVEMIRRTPDFEPLAPAVLSTVVFRYLGKSNPEMHDDDEYLNRLNSRIPPVVRHRGRVFLTETRVRDKIAIRVYFYSHRTKDEDLLIILDEIRQAAQQV
ncbi:MAG: pyridoxal phosphate-dependent decarboxylase family protein [Anaerolineales bacterium]